MEENRKSEKLRDRICEGRSWENETRINLNPKTPSVRKTSDIPKI
jgi:hypothetical protein